MLDGYATYARRHTQKTFVTIHFSLKKVHSLNWAPVIPLWAVCTLQPSTYGAWKFKMGIITHRCFYYGIFIHFSIVLWDFRNFYFMACDTQICSGKSFTDRCLLAKFLRSLFMKRDWHYLSAPELSVFAFLPFTLLPFSQITSQEMISRAIRYQFFIRKHFCRGYHPLVKYVEDSTFYITDRNSCFSSFMAIMIEEVVVPVVSLCLDC